MAGTVGLVGSTPADPMPRSDPPDAPDGGPTARSRHPPTTGRRPLTPTVGSRTLRVQESPHGRRRHRRPTPPAPLLPLVAAGDQHAMGQLVRRFEPLVRAIARRRDHHAGSGDDLVQETMLRLWRSAHRFDPDRGAEPAFVAAVARNAAIDMARHRATRPVTPTADIAALVPPVPHRPSRSPTPWPCGPRSRT